MFKDSDRDQQNIKQILRIAARNPDHLNPESFLVGMDRLNRTRLLKQIAWFLMGMLSVMFGVFLLYATKIISLPDGVVKGLTTLFCVQVIGLLGIILKALSKSPSGSDKG